MNAEAADNFEENPSNESNSNDCDKDIINDVIIDLCDLNISSNSLNESMDDLLNLNASFEQKQESENENEDEMISVDVKLEHFELLKLIGEGSFGQVFIVRNKLIQINEENEDINANIFAMKIISKKLLYKKNNISYMISERNILAKFSHPFLVSLCYAYTTVNKLYLVMDFLGGGELFYHLRRCV